MKTTSNKKLLCFASVLTLAFTSSLSGLAMAQKVAPRVNPEPAELDSSTEAKIQKVKAKSNAKGSGGQGAEGCGNVNINSNDSKKKPGLVGGEKTTIITGDVINTARCK